MVYLGKVNKNPRLFTLTCFNCKEEEVVLGKGNLYIQQLNI